jgi:hypothetical protein
MESMPTSTFAQKGSQRWNIHATYVNIKMRISITYTRRWIDFLFSGLGKS